MPITRHQSPELDAVRISGCGFDTHFIVGCPCPGVDAGRMFTRVADYAREAGAQIVSQFVFGGSDKLSAGIPGQERGQGIREWPVTWIHGDGPEAGQWSGTQAHAVSGASIKPIGVGDRILGSTYEDADAVHCVLGDIRPNDASAPRRAQARETFENIERALACTDMDFVDVVRTWFYLDNLLEWYDEFNDVRTSFFRERGVFGRVVPASTGIGAGNSSGAAIVADVVAVKPKHGAVRIAPVASPLQCPALNYKSSFSRALEIQSGGHRRLYVSGTASIGGDGKSVHAGDIGGQIARTIDVVEAIIDSRRMRWHDAARAVAYFKNIQDAPLFDVCLKKRGMPRLPVSIAHADICRAELLFELEVDLAAEG